MTVWRGRAGPVRPRPFSALRRRAPMRPPSNCSSTSAGKGDEILGRLRRLCRCWSPRPRRIPAGARKARFGHAGVVGLASGIASALARLERDSSLDWKARRCIRSAETALSADDRERVSRERAQVSSRSSAAERPIALKIRRLSLPICAVISHQRRLDDAMRKEGFESDRRSAGLSALPGIGPCCGPILTTYDVTAFHCSLGGRVHRTQNGDRFDPTQRVSSLLGNETSNLSGHAPADRLEARIGDDETQLAQTPPAPPLTHNPHSFSRRGHLDLRRQQQRLAL